MPFPHYQGHQRLSKQGLIDWNKPQLNRLEECLRSESAQLERFMALGIIGDLVDDMRIIHGIRVLDSL